MKDNKDIFAHKGHTGPITLRDPGGLCFLWTRTWNHLRPELSRVRRSRYDGLITGQEAHDYWWDVALASRGAA